MLEPKPLIFTDLDGTLLDHDNYSFAAANDTLKQLAKYQIPLIPNTSKTFAELVAIRETLALGSPFIVENGAAIFIPQNYFTKKPELTVLMDGYWVKQFTLPRAHWIDLIKQNAKTFSTYYQCFSSLSPKQIQDLTGLSQEEAKLASQRQFGEPLHWLGNDSQKQSFIETMTKQGATILQGGRFIHVSGNCDKGKALQWLCNEFCNQYPGQRFTSIALGDSQNDNTMLEAADIAVQIKSPKHGFEALRRTENLYQSQFFGPEGWHATLQQILFQ